jgi:hypothetical protein
LRPGKILKKAKTNSCVRTEVANPTQLSQREEITGSLEDLRPRLCCLWTLRAARDSAGRWRCYNTNYSLAAGSAGDIRRCVRVEPPSQADDAVASDSGVHAPLPQSVSQLAKVQSTVVQLPSWGWLGPGPSEFSPSRGVQNGQRGDDLSVRRCHAPTSRSTALRTRPRKPARSRQSTPRTCHSGGGGGEEKP